MDWLNTYYNLISVIIGIFAIFPTIIIPLYQHFRQRAENIGYARIKNIVNNLKNWEQKEDRTSWYITEYDRLAFNKVFKTRLSYDKQVKLQAFYENHKDKFDWEQVRTASKYFDFVKDEIGIKIPLFDKISYIYFILVLWVIGLMVFASLVTLMWFLDNYQWYEQLVFVLFPIIFIAIAIFAAAYYLAPINVARHIKKRLKEN